MTRKIRFFGQHVANGFAPGEFDHLSDRDKASLRRLLARVAERSYRRGAQQGAEMSKRGEIGVKIHDWRYGPSLDRAPWLHGVRVETSLARLDMENGCLRDIGLGPAE